MFLSLDFVYVSTEDVDEGARLYVELLGAVWKVRRMSTVVPCLRVAQQALELHELEIPQGPLATFTAPGGQRLAVYELTRPHAADHFAGRID